MPSVVRSRGSHRLSPGTLHPTTQWVRFQRDRTIDEPVDVHACDSDEGDEEPHATKKIFLHGYHSLESRENQRQVEDESRIACHPFPHGDAGKGSSSDEQTLNIEARTA